MTARKSTGSADRNADLEAARQQQHTGNHDKPAPRGGTREGAENVEHPREGRMQPVDAGAQADAAKKRSQQKGYD